MACGADHALALTIYHELFSWGSGKYGCLGFDNTEDQKLPKKLEIKDYKDENINIKQIACGKFHSIVLSDRSSVYTWGRGLKGQLGLDSDEDKMGPTEIYYLSQRKPKFIAAGENHGAAISEKNQLYTWGNGGFGRLGHGNDESQKQPKIVENLQTETIVYVSCGAFHTLCVDDKGIIYSFGQNKYGKLGIYSQSDREGDCQSAPKKISMFRDSSSGNPKKYTCTGKDKFLKVVASTNHSMSLTRSGKLFSWGYKGKGLLGRHVNG